MSRACLLVSYMPLALTVPGAPRFEFAPQGERPRGCQRPSPAAAQLSSLCLNPPRAALVAGARSIHLRALRQGQRARAAMDIRNFFGKKPAKAPAAAAPADDHEVAPWKRLENKSRAATGRKRAQALGQVSDNFVRLDLTRKGTYRKRPTKKGDRRKFERQYARDDGDVGSRTTARRAIDGDYNQGVDVIGEDACIEEAKNDAQRSLEGARARWMAGDLEAQRRFVVLYAPTESGATVWLQPRHWGPFRLECVPLETDLAEEGDIVVLAPDQILDWAEFGPEGDAPIKGGFTDRCGRMLEKARKPS